MTNSATIRVAGASSVEVADEQVSFTYNRFYPSNTIRIHFVKKLSCEIDMNSLFLIKCDR